jgi:hypothetical protein
MKYILPILGFLLLFGCTQGTGQTTIAGTTNLGTVLDEPILFEGIECEESDFGDQPELKGSVTLYDNEGSILEYEADSCLSETLLREWRCIGHVTFTEHTINCARGCSEGRCLE